MSRIANIVRVFLQKAADTLFSCRCLKCQAIFQRKGASEVHFLCPACWGSIRPMEGASCPICAAPFASIMATVESPHHICGTCREHRPAFSCAITPFAYQDPLAHVIQVFKYQKKNVLAIPLAQLLQEHLTLTEIDCVVAIPLHPKRLRAREFNQSLLLAREIAHYKDRPLMIDALQKEKDTTSQVGLSRKERQGNIKGAFKVVDVDLIRDLRVLLVDDVYTTGATLREGADILMRAGAREVVVCALARML